MSFVDVKNAFAELEYKDYKQISIPLKLIAYNFCKLGLK